MFLQKHLSGILLCALVLMCGEAVADVRVVTDTSATPREEYGAEAIRAALKDTRADRKTSGEILVVVQDSRLLSGDRDLRAGVPKAAEGFRLARRGKRWIVAGSDASGALYGALELAARVRAAGRLPETIDFADAPSFVLRGACVGMQKTTVTYDGAIYDYPYTRENFPFFYDRKHWLEYLDFLAQNRMNTLYLWNGHPFTSLLKLPRFPEAQEISDEQLEENIALFRWLTEEADRRGIWVIQLFYNIHISHALARARGVPFHLSAPHPLASDYTRYAVAEFIRNYPHVGLMVTLGEALRPEHGAEWLSKTIIPGVKDGMKAAGLQQEPPLIVRAHATRIDDVIATALPLYKNIYTMHKWNGESLTWWDVRGEQRALHEKLASLGSLHIANVHLLANLEPFRWGAPSFIQNTMKSCRRIGIRGLHLYPLRYWEWPISADAVNPPLKQIERDWIWFEAWARYAWNPERGASLEHQYWVSRLAEKYGSREAGERILEAYEKSGVCAPRLLPRIGITEGNRQAFSLGMLMTQLINDERYSPFPWLWEGDAPPGERLREWVEKEWRGQPHQGETPLGVAAEVTSSAAEAVAAAEAARPYVTRNREEFARLLDDMRAIATLMKHYQKKTEAAAWVLRYGLSRDPADLERALPLLEQSLEEYRQLVALTDKAYREACSIHSASRRIPFWGAPGRYTHWRDCLPEYEKELERFRSNRKLAASGKEQVNTATAGPLPGVDFRLSDGPGERFAVRPGERIYVDETSWSIRAVAPELAGLTGIRIPYREAESKGVRLKFVLSEPAQILVGFFRTHRPGRAAEPPANEWAPALMNAVDAGSHPGFSVWSHALPAGMNELDLGRGAYVVFGFVKQDVRLQPRMVFYESRDGGGRAYLDWLFE